MASVSAVTGIWLQTDELACAAAVFACRLRTSRKLWNITERHETVTEDCYSYTLGADTLVVLTNRGSNLGNATKTCSITLPANSQLMRKGLTGVQDVLDFQQVSPLASNPSASALGAAATEPPHTALDRPTSAASTESS